MDRPTRVMFMLFCVFVMLLTHWNVRQLLSQVSSSCIQGHATTLTQLDDFKSSLLQSDLLVTFVDKSDLVELQKENKEAQRKVSVLTRRLKLAQTNLVSYNIVQSCI
jgi:ribonuclease PH